MENYFSREELEYWSVVAAVVNIVYSRYPKTDKLFMVFRSETAVLPLRSSEAVVSVHCVDDIFIEREDCADHFAVNGSELRLTASGQLDKGYIVEIH